MDINGNGLLLRADKLHLTLGRPHESPENLLIKLRQLCILSGCDYVNSLPGVGLVKAKKFVMACSDPDFLNVNFTCQ
jgi:exonuclease 1